MRPVMKLKMSINAIMTLGIIMLMAYQITGQFLHEIAGTIMIVLFAIHNVLNHRWYRNLFKGKYHANRIWMTAINISLCVVVLLLAYSGITMSGYVFRFIPDRTGVAVARLIHLAAAYWGFALISLHLGTHWQMILGVLHVKRESANHKIFIRLVQGSGFLVAIYGAICFIQSGIISYMTLKNQFVFYDSTQPTWQFLLRHIAMMIWFAFVGYYISKMMKGLTGYKPAKENVKKTKNENMQETDNRNMQETDSGNLKKKERCNGMKKIKKRWCILGGILVVAIILFCTMGITYIRRHFVTNEMSVSEIVNGNHAVINRTEKILTVYFTRLGNSDFEENVDVVSSASLIQDGDTIYGNSQVLAQMVQNVVGGDIYAITTEKKYPSSYGDTVEVAKTELDENARPKLNSKELDLSAYDTIILVYPVWWGRIPMPVATFLENYDFSGKTVMPLVTHGGSGAGESILDIQKLCKGSVKKELEIYDDELSGAREAIVSWLGNN